MTYFTAVLSIFYIYVNNIIYIKYVNFANYILIKLEGFFSFTFKNKYLGEIVHTSSTGTREKGDKGKITS